MNMAEFFGENCSEILLIMTWGEKVASFFNSLPVSKWLNVISSGSLDEFGLSWAGAGLIEIMWGLHCSPRIKQTKL